MSRRRAPASRLAPALTAELQRLVQVNRPKVRGIAIARGDDMLFEEYFQGFDRTSYHRINSITKSVVSALVGIALERNLLALEDPVTKFFQPEVKLVTDVRLHAITVRHLLMMTSGFQRHILGGYIRSLDPFGQLLRRQIARPPGTIFRYDNADADLLAGLLERAVSEPLAAFAQRVLFEPLGIWRELPVRFWLRLAAGRHSFTPWCSWDERLGTLWKTNAAGGYKGAYGLHMTVRELLAFGRLYEQTGCWNGRQLIPASYVAASLTVHSGGGYPMYCPYGYLWWLDLADSAPAFFASGFGGQMVYVIPASRIVIVVVAASNLADCRPSLLLCRTVATAVDIAA